MVGNFRSRRFSGKIVLDCLAVDAHVGVVDERQQAQAGGTVCQQFGVQFEFVIFGAGAAQIPFQVDAVGHLRHKRLGKAEDPVAIVVFGENSYGVAASVGGVVVGAVVVDGP